MLSEVGDAELASQNLLACLFAVSALTGKPPSEAIKPMVESLDDDSTWLQGILPEIMGGHRE
jgi:hypothetical protein